MRFKYFPILKTRDSELEGLWHVSDKNKDNILPIFELTKSRAYTHPKTKITRLGDLEKQIDKVVSIWDNRKFILDITTDKSLMDAKMERLLDPYNGFENYCNFLDNPKIKNNVIPVIQIDTRKLNDTKLLISKLSSKYNVIAIRIKVFSFEEEDIPGSKVFKINNLSINKYIKAQIDFIQSEMSDKCSLIVILDAAYVYAANELANYEKLIKNIGEKLTQISGVKGIIIASSSFPSYVKELSAEDNEGKFPALETHIYKMFKSIIPSICFGDYASVHPIKYNSSGGKWVPRIDIVINSNFYYFRYPDKLLYNDEVQSGYVIASNKIMDKYFHNLPDCWGKNEIKEASISTKNTLHGKSPRFWISVRICLYITTILLELEERNCPFLEI